MSLLVGAVAVRAVRRAAASAIASAEARTALERIATEQAALRRVATLVAEGASAEDLFSAVVREVAQVLDLPVITLARYESEATAAILASLGDSGLATGSWWPLDGPSLGAMVFETGRPARIDDYSGLPGTVAAARRDSSTGSTVGVPITVDGKVWGLMCVGLTGREPLPSDTEERLAGFTELIATAIANAEAGTAIARLADEQAALRRVATLVARGLQPGQVFAAVAEELAGVLEVEHAHVVRYEADATATIVASWGNESGSWGDDAVLWSVGSNWTLEGESVSARVFRTGLPARIDDCGEADDESAPANRRIGGRSTVGAPIVIDDRLWGAAITASAYGSLPASAEARIATFTELIGIAISNAETRTELTASRARVVAAADETRRRIERDLHDGLQQRLVSLALKVRAAEEMSPRPSSVMQGELWRLADGLRAALDELREISHGIHPAILSKGGLGPALKALARRSDVPIALDLQLDSRLEESLEVAAYYIASEAITNALKHAQASAIELHVDSRDGALTLTVRDNGIGGADPRGSGIIGLTDRVEALGGTITVVSPPGDGTTLHAHLPADPGVGPAPRGAAPSAPRTTTI
jgi:signal transduction histidine kinase